MLQSHRGILSSKLLPQADNSITDVTLIGIQTHAPKGEEGSTMINVGHKDLCQAKQEKKADSTVKEKKKKLKAPESTSDSKVRLSGSLMDSLYHS